MENKGRIKLWNKR